jgi:ferredoxin
MAKVKLDDQEREMTPDDNFRETTEDMGVPFGCETGICGTCEVIVHKGGEHLTPLTPHERDMGLSESEPYRLCCQCQLKKETPPDAEIELEQ